jgi:hypothetical protein
MTPLSIATRKEDRHGTTKLVAIIIIDVSQDRIDRCQVVTKC